MENKTYTVGAFAKLTGVTERTLRFYHKKGLLEPSGYNDLGHRLYGDRDLVRLQQILTLKFLDYPLERITDELQAEGGALRRSLEHQRKLLRQKRDQLNRMLHTLEHTLDRAEGEEAEWEPDVLLLMIHSVSTEEEQRRWIAEQLPDSLLDRFWPQGEGDGKWRAMERETMQWISRVGSVMAALERPLTEQEQLFRFPMTFTAEEERYLERMWDAAIEENEAKNPDGEKPNEGGTYGQANGQ